MTATDPLEAHEDSEDLEDSNTQGCSPAHNSSSSLDEAVMPPPPTVADDSKQFQDLFKRVAQSQNIPLEEVTENQHQLLKNTTPSVLNKDSTTN